MRWRGDSVRPRDGHFGSQKPHSMHLSTSGSAAGSGFRLRRCASGSSLRITPGLSRPCGSNRCLIARISWTASASPLELDERRDVAAGAVLGLERAVVLLHHHPAQRVHEAAIARDLRRIVEVLREHEVQVALERVAEDDRAVVAVRAQQALQVERGLGEPCTGKATSSMITVVPVSRIAPTDGNMPLRTAQKRAHSPASREKRAGAAVWRPASARSITATWRSSVAASPARVSTSSAAPSAGVLRGPRQAGLALDRPQCRAIGELGRVDRSVLDRRDGRDRRFRGRRTGSARWPCGGARAPCDR